MKMNWKGIMATTLSLGLLSASMVMAQESDGKSVPVDEVVLVSKTKDTSAAPGNASLIRGGNVRVRVAAH